MQFLADFLGRFDAIYSYTITDKAVTLHNFRPDHARKIEKALETSDIEGVILLDDVIG
jgi:bisphosphoglycerate-independent phosphoglycerate mutase (AlkP superfamily)